MRVSYVWYDHDAYVVQLDETLVGMLFKTFEGYWTFRRYKVDDEELQAFLRVVPSVVLRKTNHR